MTLSRKSLILFLLASVCLQACNKIKLEEPNYGAYTELPEHLNSTLNIPIDIQFDDIEDLINGQLKKVLYEDNSFTDKNNDGLKLKVTRLSKINLMSSKNKLLILVPLKVELVTLLKTKVLGKTIQKEKAMDFSARLLLSTSVKLNDKWQLLTKLKLDKIEWIDKPDMRLLGIKINLTKMVEKKLAENQATMLAAIDKAILEKVNLEKPVQNIWNNLHKPIRISNKVHQVWLMVQPQDLLVSPMKMRKKHIEFDISLSSKLSTRMGEMSELPKETPLPTYHFKPDTTTQFNLHLLGQLPFELINNTLKDSLAGREFDIEGKKLKIKSVKISGSGPRIVLRLDVKGDVKGNVFMSGIPQYNHETGVFSISDFSFDIESEEILLQAADWMFHSDLIERVNQKLNWPIGTQIDRLPELISQGIGKSKISEKVNIQIDNMNIKPSDVIVRQEGLYFQVHATGNAALSVTKLIK